MSTYAYLSSAVMEGINESWRVGQEVVLVMFCKQTTRDGKAKWLSPIKSGEGVSPSPECCLISWTFHWPVLIICIIYRDDYLVLLFQHSKQVTV